MMTVAVPKNIGLGEGRMYSVVPNNMKGQSLVQTLVSMGIMAIVMTAFASMLSNQNRETTALSEKLAKLELKNTLISLIATGGACSYKIGVPPQTVNAATPSIVLNQLYLGTQAGALTLVSANTPYSSDAKGLIPTQIKLNNIQNPLPNFYRANLEVTFNTASLVRGLDKISIPVYFSTSAANQINSCLGANNSSSPNYILVRWAGPDGDVNTAIPPTCPAGYTLMNWVPVSSYDNWTTVGICTLQ